MRRLVFSGVALALVTLPVVARAGPDVKACLAASEKGQQSRSGGKLREAHEHFLVCGSDSCPGLVRHDCTQWNAELAAAAPTVVFGAHDKQGHESLRRDGLDGRRSPPEEARRQGRDRRSRTAHVSLRAPRLLAGDGEGARQGRREGARLQRDVRRRRRRGDVDRRERSRGEDERTDAAGRTRQRTRAHESFPGSSSAPAVRSWSSAP